MRKREVIDAAGGDDAEGDRRFVGALARGLEVLRSFRQGDRELGNQDFADRTGLPKATVSRLTYTLSKLGYLSYNYQTGRYRLDTPVLSLGYSFLAGAGIRHLAKPLMQELADYSGVPVALAGRDRACMVYLECCKSASAITLAIEVGAHIKLGSSSLGRAYIVALPDAERTAVMAELKEREGENWPQVQSGIFEALDTYRKHGYCLSVGQWKTDVNSVGVPFRPRDGSPILAFNCGGPSFLVDRTRLTDDIGPRLVDLVRRLDAAMPNS